MLVLFDILGHPAFLGFAFRVSNMESTLSFCQDGVILACLHLFGLSYFVLFLTSFLLFQFPAQADTISCTQGVIFYCGGAILWSLCSLVYWVIWIIHGNDTRLWQKLEFVSILLLIYTLAILLVVLQSAIHIYSCLVCLLCLTIAMTQAIVEIITVDGLDSDRAFWLCCLWLRLLALMLAMYILLHPAAGSLSLALGLV